MYLDVIMFTFLTELRGFFFNVKLLIFFCLGAIPHPPTLCGDSLKISYSTKMLVTKEVKYSHPSFMFTEESYYLI